MIQLRIQSAMEYLMTYGWAILIIAVVLGALFGLGFFNSANLAPKVSAGACQVYRPDGPGTTTFINTEGTCNNELPQYVAQLNGQTSNIIVSQGPLITGNQVTFVAWADQVGPSGSGGGAILSQYNSALLPCSTSLVYFQLNLPPGTTYDIYGSACQQNQWVQYVGTYNGVTMTLYVDGAAANSLVPSVEGSLHSGSVVVGENRNGNNPFNGLIANVQIYNTSLSANEVTALYDEGLGGVPILPQYLVGWWPLNGNANDYSGNLNNGAPANVFYTSSWTSAYTAP